MVRSPMSGWTSVLCVLAVSAGAASGQEQRDDARIEYRLSDPVVLPAVRPDDLYVEPHLSIDPFDPEHLVAASMALIDAGSTSNRRLVVFESFDGGRTWSDEQLSSLDDLDPIDVWTAFAADGSVLLSSMVQAPRSGRGLISNVRVFRKEVNSATWSEPVVVPSGRGGGLFDHTTLSVDRTYSKSHGLVYVCGHQNALRRPGTRRRAGAMSCARSDDGGRSFEGPGRFTPTNIDLMMPSQPVFLEDGTLLMAFSLVAITDLEGRQRVLDRGVVGAIRSNDGARSYLPFGVIAVEEAVSWADVAVDNTYAPHHDRVYTVWHQNGLFRPGVLFSYSPDGGRLWSEAERLSKGSGAGFHASNVEVDSNGVVGVMWVRREKQVIGCFELLFRASRDGGLTFAEPVQVAKQGSCQSGEMPGAPAVLEDLDAWKRWGHGGDYLGLATDSQGRFHVLWAQPTDDAVHFRLVTRRIEVVGS